MSTNTSRVGGAQVVREPVPRPVDEYDVDDGGDEEMDVSSDSPNSPLASDRASESGGPSGMSMTLATDASGAALLPSSSRFAECTDYWSPYPHCPVFVPSSGRSEQERATLALLVRDLVPFTVIVEKEEAEAYGALLDRLVYTHYGAGGMMSPEAVAEAAAAATAGTSASRDDSAAPPATATPSLPRHLECACCVHPNQRAAGETKGEERRNGGAPASTGSVRSPDAIAEVARPMMEALSTAYHHGFVFRPEAAAEASVSHAPAPPLFAAVNGSPSSSTREPSEPFVVSTVEQVRALFTVAVLPASRKGVSYVRNYILHVLVPQLMLASGVDSEADNTRFLRETALFGADETGKLNATMMAGALTSQQAVQQLKASRAAALKASSPFEAAVASFYETRQPQDDEEGGPQSSGTSAHINASADAKTSGAPGPTFPQYEALRQQRALVQHQREQVDSPHALVGFYWVLDDDITSFHKTVPTQKLQRLSVRAMMADTEARVLRLRANSQQRQGGAEAGVSSPTGRGNHSPAGSPSSLAGAGAPVAFGGIRPMSPSSPHMVTGHFASSRLGGAIFTGREDALVNNSLGDANSSGTWLSTRTFDGYSTIACYSLEYSRFAFSYDDDALGINTYNNIACLFNYRLLHDPPCPVYFPPNLLGRAVRTPQETLVGYAGRNMMWYRFAVREDYDFTLQLIARGMSTVRFRNLSFAAPQMAKNRGGMTDYYKNCHAEIEQQNDRFVLQWPAVAQHWVKGKGPTARKDIRVRWDLLHPARARYPGAYLYLSEPLPQLQPQPPSQVPPLSTAASPVTESTSAMPAESAQAESTAPVASGLPASPTSPAAGSARPAPATATATAAAPPATRPQKVPVKAAAVMGYVPASLVPAKLAPVSSSPPPPPSAATPVPPTTGPAPSTVAESPAVPPVKRQKVEEPAVSTPSPPPPPSGKWRGYAVLSWRQIGPEEAARLGLRHIPNEALHPGSSVAVIPPLFSQQPSVVNGTVIEKSVDEHTGTTLWSVVSRVRGMPILSVPDCYEPLQDGLDAAIAAVDAHFRDLQD